MKLRRFFPRSCPRCSSCTRTPNRSYTATSSQATFTPRSVSPTKARYSIWAWRADRVEKIRASADHVLCIFPFEPELLARQGIAATYVGHPLASVIPRVPDKAAARAQLGLAVHDEVLAILPGSRSAEVAYIAKPFFQAAALIKKARPAIKIVVPAVPALRARIEQIARDRLGLAYPNEILFRPEE